MKVLLTGGSGFIGTEIGRILVSRGHQVYVVSRKGDVKDNGIAKSRFLFPCQVVVGDLNKSTLSDPSLLHIEGVINLMGESIAGRWTEKKKQNIYQSRVRGTHNLVQSLPNNLQVFVEGSAVGAYGNRGDEVLNETSALGNDFLACVCRDWEKEASLASGRKVIVRTGIVWSVKDGAFPKLLLPFRLGLGGPLASGRQWMSWIHIEDIARLFVEALENPNYQGIINATAPEPLTNFDFSKRLAQRFNKGLRPAVPEIALKLLFAEGADAILASQRCQSRVQDLGFQFRFPKVGMALENLMEAR